MRAFVSFNQLQDSHYPIKANDTGPSLTMNISIFNNFFTDFGQSPKIGVSDRIFVHLKRLHFHISDGRFAVSPISSICSYFHAPTRNQHHTFFSWRKTEISNNKIRNITESKYLEVPKKKSGALEIKSTEIVWKKRSYSFAHDFLRFELKNWILINNRII